MLGQFVEQTGITFPIGLDRGTSTSSTSYNSFMEGAGVSPFPLDVIIGRDGVVRYVARKFDPAAMRPVVEAALAQ